MMKNTLVAALALTVALVGVLYSGGVGRAAGDTFEGTWYTSLGGAFLRIELHRDAGRMAGSSVLLVPGQNGVPLPVSKAEESGDTLHLELSNQGIPGLPEVISIELRVPRNELVGEMILREGMPGISLVMSRDNPELAARFSGVEVLSPEEMRQEMRQMSEGSLRSSCANNLKQLGIVMKMFANESPGGKFPALDPRPGYLQFLKSDVYPEYLTDVKVLACPADEEAMAKDSANDPQWFFDHSAYWYTGHAIGNETEGAAFVAAYRQAVETGAPLAEDYDGGDGQARIYRVREGIERFLITDINNPAGSAQAQSRIPVLIERPDNHVPPGGNVLFMDGHVEFLKYPGTFPMTETFVASLRALDALRAKGE